MPTNKTYKENITAAGVLALLLVIFFANAIFTGKALVSAGNIFSQSFYRPYAPAWFTRAPNIVLDDQYVQFYPLQKFVEQSLHKGHVPLWDTHVILGVPVHGTGISAFFYPWNFLAALIPLTALLWIRPFLNFWVAGFFTFLFVRRLGGGLAGAYLSAISFMFCGFMVVWMGHPHTNAAAWLPALLYLAELFITVKAYRKICAIFSAIAVSFIFFAGHMETAFEVCLACLLYYVIRSYQVEGRKRILGNAAAAAGVLILGVLLAAVQILPYLEWLRISAEFAKRNAVPFSFLNLNHLKQLPSLVALFLPNFLINPSQIDFPFISLVPWGNFNEIAVYLGIIPLVIVIQGLWIKREKHSLISFFVVGGIFFLCLAFRLPGFDWINQMPVFSIFAPRRWRLIFDLCTAIAAGLALDLWFARLEDGAIRKKTARFFLVCGIAAIAAVEGIHLMLVRLREPIINHGRAYAKAQYLATSIHSRTLDQVLADITVFFDRVVNYFSLLNWRLYFPGLVLIVAAGMIIALRKKLIKPEIFKYGLAGLTFIDLCVFGIGYNPAIAEKDIYPPTPAVRFLKQDRSIFRILPMRSEWTANGPLMYGIDQMAGADLPTRYYKEFTDAIEGKDGQGFICFSIQSANSKLIDLTNVKYVVTTNKFNPAPGRDLRLCWQKDGIYIYENHKVLPRAFIVHKARVVTDDKIVAALQDTSFDPASEVLLADNRAVGFPGGGDSLKDERVVIISYAHERVVMRTRSSGGMMILSDSYYPGWRAYLDKREIPIYRANCVMRAVQLPAGEHEIEFRYWPFSLYLGAAISAGALLLIVAAMIVLRLRKKDAVE